MQQPVLGLVASAAGLVSVDQNATARDQDESAVDNGGDQRVLRGLLALGGVVLGVGQYLLQRQEKEDIANK